MMKQYFVTLPFSCCHYPCMIALYLCQNTLIIPTTNPLGVSDCHADLAVVHDFDDSFVCLVQIRTFET